MDARRAGSHGSSASPTRGPASRRLESRSPCGFPKYGPGALWGRARRRRSSAVGQSNGRGPGSSRRGHSGSSLASRQQQLAVGSVNALTLPSASCPLPPGWRSPTQQTPPVDADPPARVVQDGLSSAHGSTARAGLGCPSSGSSLNSQFPQRSVHVSLSEVRRVGAPMSPGRAKRSRLCRRAPDEE